MQTRTSGFLLALTITLTAYLLMAAIWLDGSATTPADHAAAKVLGVLAGGLGIVVLFMLGRRALQANPSLMPGYVPPAQDGDGAP